MAVNFLVPLLIPLGEQITNVSELSGSGTLAFSKPDQVVTVPENRAPVLLAVLKASSNTTRTSVTYEIVSGNEQWQFYIHSRTGRLQLSVPLDYEYRNIYDVFVGAVAGAEKTFGRVVVNVSDVNDNPPSFLRPLYETQVTEEDDRHLPRLILRVTAHDVDVSDQDRLRYSIMVGEIDSGFYPNSSMTAPVASRDKVTSMLLGTSTGSFHEPAMIIKKNPVRIPENSTSTEFFAINSKTGDITFIKPLDRDAPNGFAHWYLWVGVSDGLHHDTARLLVNVKDINDNAPFFEDFLLSASLRENANAGELVVTARAVDYDDVMEAGHTSLTYAIEKNVIDEATGKPFFDIDPLSGRITTALCCPDREKTPSFQVQVVATDGGGLKGTGSVVILVEDENDALPVFSSPIWRVEVPENVEPHTPIGLLSVDDDDITNQFSYRVVPNSGPGWDRFTVTASDASGLLQNYELTATLASTTGTEGNIDGAPDEQIGSIYRSDSGNIFKPDVQQLPPLNKLAEKIEKSLPKPPNKQGAVLSALTKLDYEDTVQRRGFKFLVQVTDKPVNWSLVPPQLPSDVSTYHSYDFMAAATSFLYPEFPRISTCWVEISLLDSNDNPPKLLKSSGKLTLPEDFPVGSKLEEFPASDMDSGINGFIQYAISPESDPGKLFMADSVGRVLLQNSLDRETQREHAVLVLVADAGVPPNTVTATLRVSVTDVNDNPPYISSMKLFPKSGFPTDNEETLYLARSHSIAVQENDVPRTLATLSLDDPDDWELGHGPPFHLSIDPASAHNIIRSFAVDYNSQNSGNGIGTIRSLVPLDREAPAGARRLLPLLLSDVDGRSTTVTIAVHVSDVNDNPMKPGTKQVQVVRVKGERKMTPLGRVHVSDPDDWDADEKTWRWRTAPHPLFWLDFNTGQLVMLPLAPDGRYELRFLVDDMTHNQQDVPANVSVEVASLDPNDVVRNSVVITIADTTPNLIIDKEKGSGDSPLERLLAAASAAARATVEFVALEAAVPETSYLHGPILEKKSRSFEAANSISRNLFRSKARSKSNGEEMKENEWISSSSMIYVNKNTKLIHIRSHNTNFFGEFSEATGVRVWVYAKTNFSLDQLLLLHIDEISEASGLNVFSIGVGICGEIPESSEQYERLERLPSWDEGTDRQHLLPLTHPNYQEHERLALQEKLAKAADQFWLVDSNKTSVVTPRLEMSLKCGCFGSLTELNEHHESPNFFQERTLTDERTGENLPAYIKSWPVKTRLQQKQKENVSMKADQKQSNSSNLVSNNYHYLHTFESLHDKKPRFLSVLKKCHDGICLNGGRCIEDSDRARCICPEGTSQPFCKQLVAHFNGVSQMVSNEDKELPGNGEHAWMWLGTARLCSPMHISLEFRTSEDSGMLMYAGPRPRFSIFSQAPKTTRKREGEIRNLLKDKIILRKPTRSNRAARPVETRHRQRVWNQNPHDNVVKISPALAPVLSIELLNGQPKVLFSLGAEATVLSPHASTLTENALNFSDNSWHRLDFLWSEKQIELLSDLCRDGRPGCHLRASVDSQMSAFRGEDRSRSTRAESEPELDKIKAEVPSLNSDPNSLKQLPPSRDKTFNSIQDSSSPIFNPETPFQVGGLAHERPKNRLFGWPKNVVSSKAFTGCIRNIRINNQLQDLGQARLCRGVQPGCQHPSVCTTRACPRNTRCSTTHSPPSCECLPGLRGPLCSQASQSVTLTRNSYAALALSFRPPTDHTHIQVRVRTRSSAGQILQLSSQQNRDQLRLHFVEGRVCLTLLARLETEELWESSKKNVDNIKVPPPFNRNGRSTKKNKKYGKAAPFISMESESHNFDGWYPYPFRINDEAENHSPKKSRFLQRTDDRNKSSDGWSAQPQHGKTNILASFGDKTSLPGIRIKRQDALKKKRPLWSSRSIVSQVCLSHAFLNDGNWHALDAWSYGQFLELWADDGDYPNYNSSFTEGLFSGYWQPQARTISDILPSPIPTSSSSITLHNKATKLKSHKMDSHESFPKRNFIKRNILRKETEQSIIWRGVSLPVFSTSENHSYGDPSQISKSSSEERRRSHWNEHQFIVDQQEGVLVGGVPEFSEFQLVNVEDDLMNGCLDDLRLWGHPLPLPPASNHTQAAQLSSFANMISPCASADTCVNASCPRGLLCHDTWNAFSCGCGLGKTFKSGKCEDIDECQSWSPCLSGTCVDLDPGYRCECPSTHAGDHCELSVAPSSSFQFSLRAAGLGLFTLGFLMFALAIVYFFMKRIKNRASERIKQKISESATPSSTPHTYQTHNSPPDSSSFFSSPGIPQDLQRITPCIRTQNLAYAVPPTTPQLRSSPLLELSTLCNSKIDVDVLKIPALQPSFVVDPPHTFACEREAEATKFYAVESTEGGQFPRVIVNVPDLERSAVARTEMQCLRACDEEQRSDMQSSGIDWDCRRCDKEQQIPKRRCTCPSETCRKDESASSCNGSCSCIRTKKNDSYQQTRDDLRDYAYEGDGSTPESLSSCCSGENVLL
ncbi:Laminin G domain [Trinorchestia longiramus]|nr:Laminin G domain [Trinorchestia longiramus]